MKMKLGVFFPLNFFYAISNELFGWFVVLCC